VVRAIASKSHAHRLLIAGALSDRPVRLLTPDTSKDIEATVNTLSGLGAAISKEDSFYSISPISLTEHDSFASSAELDCGESGSTLRFIIPVVGALGRNVNITMHGRLSERPLSPMYEELVRHGLTMSPQGSNPLHIEGQLTGGEYTIAGNISSQFITGLLFALPLLNEDSSLHVTGKLESRPYVDITLDVIRRFGIIVNEKPLENGETVFEIPGAQKYHSDQDIAVDGDWSNAAFFLSAGAISESPVTVTGLNLDSLQGDMKILDILKAFGAGVEISNSSENASVTVSHRPLHGAEIDAANIPDLVPVISVVAAAAEGQTIIRNIERLRIKESDRVQTVISMLSALGADISEQDNSLVINGTGQLSGGTIDSFNDHRIAMSAAIAGIITSGDVVIKQAMAVSKSYPGFYEDYRSLIK
jgi:3-phosphoshikimate 1-carboxyvinyltransferase